MDFLQFESTFRYKAKVSGYSEENIIFCLKYAKPLVEKNFPVIFNTSNLAALVGYKTQYLKRAALYTNFFYRSFTIKKANGKLRALKEPLPSLKEIQVWILQNILYNPNVPISKYAKAYIKKRNLLDNVKYHRSKEKVLTLDISNFFGSIERKSIENIFRKIGYSSNISNLLSKLCCCDNSLPQGAPTSPILSNIYLFDFDNFISKYCVTKNIRYTRYADDLAFSGNFDEEILIEIVDEKLKTLNLFLNKEKIKVMKSNQKQIITGILVNDVLQIPKSDRQLIRQEVYYIKKFGLLDHLKRTKNERSNYIPHLLGKINFALSINPKDKEMLRYKEYIQNMIVTNK